MKQQKNAHILCHTLHETGPKIELFPAEQWNRPGAKAGFYRVRIDRLWHCTDGKKYTFMTPSQIGELVVQQLGLSEPEPDDKPDMEPRQCVWIMGKQDWVMGYTVTEPIQGPDKRWRIWIRGYDFAGYYFCEEIRR